ncbi:MAG TPA: carboxypeptidase-like regulatory domain-containing protein [Pyrinomonadaceae bacterium]|nr:carboxypeptidase-like regulatory domain-containing protein [Pyrinomonadaceae bacterium]
MSHTNTIRVASLASLLVLILIAGSGYAQSGGTTIRGTVKDPNGNVVAGATVTITDPQKNFSRTQNTNQEGGYVFTAVPPGTYKLDVTAPGFKTASASGLVALVDTPTVRDVQLEIGAVSETVDVTSTAEAAINTSDASLGNSFERKRIVELPLNANNVVGLLSLQPGVTRSGFVNGGRADQSNITLDGVDVNEQQDGLDVITDEAFASVLRVTRDSLQEFRVTTTNPNAEQGRSSGAQVSLVTRSGSNQWHGSLFEIHRNTVTTANDFFNNAAGVERPQLLRNIFGGSVGGPIKKDRAFFFFTYEGFREATATSVVREVPLPTLGQGLVRFRTESGASDPGCPAGTPSGVNCLTTDEIIANYASVGAEPGINPQALQVLAAAAQRYPANDTTVGDGLNTSGFRFNARTPTELNTYIARFDFNLTNQQTLFVRGNYQNDTVTRAVYFSSDCSTAGDNIQCFPDTPALITWNHPKGLALGHVWTISPTVVNRLNYGFTRAGFTQNGDSNENRVNFRFIFSPQSFQRTLRRTTPVHNFVDDLSWVRGTHTFGFGGNVRLITNNRVSLGPSFDQAIINPSFYDESGDVLLQGFSDFQSGNDLRDALASVIGRYSQYNANLVYDASGQLQSVGTPSNRSFATQEYEGYFQDSWRMRPNFTLNYGIRWSTSTPVYERNGLQVVPNTNLTDYFNERVASSNAGVPFTDPITFILGGKANNAPAYYKQDWNNWAPSVAFAWSPDFGENTFGKIFGRDGKSVIRGGFRMTYDRIGSALAVNFDLNNLAGFTSARNINANTFDVVPGELGPLFTGFNPDVRSLDFPGANGPIPTSLQFPLTVASDEDQRIETSLDQGITTPYNYSFNFSYGRELGKGLSFEASYVGRFARKILAARDIMQLNNIRDPQSGWTYYQAINTLVEARYANVPITDVTEIAFFNNLFPFMPEWWGDTSLTPTQAAYAFIAPRSLGGDQISDYTFLQLLWDDSPDCATCPFGGGPAKFNNMFFHPQFGALSAFSTIGRSNYNSLQLSLRQRLRDDVTFDFNYTYGHSFDSVSGLQNSTSYGTEFIVNALTPDSNYASSDFDARHIINANWVVGLPFGRGKRFLSNSSSLVDQVFGGWQTTGIFRWNSGLPIQTPFDCCVWATNWNVQSNGVRVQPLQSSPTANGANGTPNIFSDPVAAYRSFRRARPGEVGDRNVLRAPSYISLDMGLYKSFRLPWEGHALQFRWEVFNVTNTQRFDGLTISDLSLGPDPFLGGNPNSDFGRFTSTQTPLNETKAGRVMQFALRYTF